MSVKVMIVEDDNDIRKHLREALELEDYEIIEAPNGKQGLMMLENFSNEELPKCIILDLMMPEMNGIDFLNVLKDHNRESFKKIKVIVATARGSADNYEELPFAIDRIQKPMDLDVLYDAIKKHCS